MKKTHSTSSSGLFGKYSYLIGDIFGLEAYHDRKNKDKNRVPWQWVLWAGLIAFCIGYVLPVDSAWILLLAAAAAAIFYFARNTETVPEQVLLLTDARSPEEKAGKKPQSKERTPRKRQNRKPRVATQSGASAQKAEEPLEKSSQNVEKQGVGTSSLVSSDTQATDTTSVANEESREVAEAQASQTPGKKTSTNRNRPRRPRAPRTTQTAASGDASETDQPTKPRRPRRRKPAATSGKQETSTGEAETATPSSETSSAS